MAGGGGGNPISASDQLVRQSVVDVKAEHVASFLSRQITPLLAQEIGSQFATRIEGTCIKHHFGKCSIKMYDKHGIVLRIDVSFFKHHRKVEHRQGPPTREVAPVKKTIYSRIDLHEILLGCNRRIWRICPHSTTSLPGSAPWGASPSRGRSKVAP
jgi:hypothetical protein